MWTKYMYEKGGLMFKYQMQLRCGTYLAKCTVLLAPPPRVGEKGILSYECMPPPHTPTFSRRAKEGISPRWIVKRTKNNPPWSYNLSLVVGQSDGRPCDPGDGLARQ
jgi:hypothetical protein